jgi:hypothetical protein
MRSVSTRRSGLGKPGVSSLAQTALFCLGVLALCFAACNRDRRGVQPQHSRTKASPPTPVFRGPAQPSAPQQIVSPPSTGSGGHPDPSIVYGNLTDELLDRKFDQIVKQSENGAIRYRVPTEMTVGQTSPVVAVINGPNAMRTEPDFQATGSANLKVNAIMQVDLGAPNSPGMFQIAADPVRSGQQLVPDGGMATWVWAVTPLRGGEQPARMQIDAYMVLNAKLPDGRPATRLIKSYFVLVPVRTQSVERKTSSFLGKNWSTLLGFVVPSGAGAVLVVWILSRKNTKKRAKSHVG